MDLSLRSLKEYLMTKEGHGITPQHNHLNDLKNLLNDMYAVRSASTCVQHVGTSYTGGLSIGEMYDKGKELTQCTCNINTDLTCDCHSRIYLPTCACNVDTYCNCQNREPEPVCGCNVDAYCDCHGRTGEATCTCHSRTPSCDCQGRTWAAACSCNYDTTCNCQSRTSN